MLPNSIASPSCRPVIGPIHTDLGDAELLRLGQRLKLARKIEAKVLNSGPLDDEELAATTAPCSALVARIADTPARTMDGLMVKVAALDWCVDGDDFGFDGETTDCRLAKQIIQLLQGRLD